MKMANGHNCSLCAECDNFSRFQIKLCEFLLISGVVIILHLVDIVISNEWNMQKMKLSQMKLKSQRFMHIILLSLLTLTLPFITMLITGALLYKVLCSIAIKRNDRRFVKFLDTFDVFYCLEDKNTTDVQGIIQSDTIELAVDNIKDKLRNVFTIYSADQIFYRRNEKYGFYYWRRYSNIDLAQYVQIEEVPEVIDNEESKNFRKLEIKLRNTDQIFRNDEGLFKVVISKNFTDETKDEYKITLKFHQSVKYTVLFEFVTRLMETSNDFHVPLNLFPELQDSPESLINMIQKLYDIFVQSIDSNNLNGIKQYKTNNCLKALKGSKPDENILYIVKDICDFNLIRNTLARLINELESFR